MQSSDLEILYEDNHLLVLNKPAGIPTQGAERGKPSLVQLAKQYIKSQYDKPGNVYLGVVSRLDSQATGVVVFARTSKAAARLSALFANRETVKVYWAVVERSPHPQAGSCLDWLAHDDEHHRVVVTPVQTATAKEARLSYRTLKSVTSGWLVEVHLESGRKHQIRVQLGSRGWPIVGDRKYGSIRNWPRGIALHARQLQFEHPVRGTPLDVIAPMPESWSEMGIADG